MLELIAIIIVIAVIQKMKANKTAPRHTPPIFRDVLPQKPVLSQKEVTRQVNKQIYGTENPQDRATVYNRLILTDRYQNIEKIAHELGISKYQALREIKKLKEEGHYLQVEIDERNYRLIYPSSRTAAAAKVSSQKGSSQKASSPKKPAPSPKEPAPKPPREAPERTFVKPSKSYRPSSDSGERYEEWMSVPPGKRVVRCSYCGADNLISEKQDPHRCSCYFCREDL